MANPIYAPQQLRKDVLGTFIEALMGPTSPDLVDKIATIVVSNSDKENYAWLADVAPLQEFVDQLVNMQLSEADIAAAGYVVLNTTQAASIAIKRDDLSDEKTGGIRQRVFDLAARARQRRNSMLCTKIEAGTSDTCYLGTSSTAEAFFSASHAARGKQSSTWSNLHTGTGVTTATVSADIATAIGGAVDGSVKGLYTYTDEADEPMNQEAQQIFVLYHPGLTAPILESLKAGIVSSTSNVQFSESNIITIREPRLTAANDYYVGICDAGLVRPFIWQDREGPKMEEVGPGSDTWTNLRQIIYAATIRGAAAYGKPQRCVKVNNT